MKTHSDVGRDKRQALLDTALLLFTERGFQGTPTALISKEARVATGTLFFYFPTKEDLIDTLYRTIKTEAGDALKVGVESEESVNGKLRRVCLNFIGWGLENPQKVRFMEQFAHSPFVSRSAQEEGMSNFVFLSQIVENGIMEGVIKPYPPDLVFHMLAMSGSTLITLLRKTEDQNARKILVEQGLDLIWNGLGTG
jgi:AcrR family transcriptional regulator